MGRDGNSIRDIAEATGLSKDMVARRLRSPERREPATKSPSVSPAVKKRRQMVKKLHKKNQRSTSSEIAWALAAEGVHVTKRTVARDQVELGARHLTCDRVQKVTEKQREDRVTFAKELLAAHPPADPWWELAVFSDETYRGTSDMDATAWVFPGEARATRVQTRWDMKIHVWGYIGTRGLRGLQLLEGPVTATSYLATLKRTIGRREWRRARQWQQDNASSHSAKTVGAWLQKNVSCMPKWPANSPDLSPIENLWGRMWADALKRRPSTKEQLWDAVKATFDEYDDSYIDKLIMSFRRRLQACVECGGASISGKY